MTGSQGSGIRSQESESDSAVPPVVRRPSSIIHRLSSAARRHWDALAFFAASLILYVATAAPSVATVFDDSLEFQVVLPTLGIAHPSGYPLYTLLGKLFTALIPFRDPAGRANLLSALAAALTIGDPLSRGQAVCRQPSAAAVATAAFAISPAWWSQATLAEVYALHGLLMILFMYLLLRWEEARRQGSGVRGQGSGVRRASVKRQFSAA